jgi:hypothetical protein
LPIDLARVFAPPVIAGVGSIALYLALARVVDLNALPLLVRVVVKGGFAAGVFGAVLLLIERRALIERVSYIVRLFRSSAT